MTLAVHEAGQGPSTLVLLHGFTDSGAAWADAIERWAPHFRVLALDALGHGDSPRLTPEQLVEPGEAMFETTVEYLESLGEPVTLVGHSMGGAMAAAIAARRPELVRAAVLEDPAWSDENVDMGAWVEASRAFRADPEGKLAEARRSNPTWPESEFEPWAQSNLDVQEELVARGRITVTTPWREIAASISVPVLVISGTEQVILDSAVLDEIEALGNPAIDIRVVAGAGHCVRRDRTDDYHAVVDPWLGAGA